MNNLLLALQVLDLLLARVSTVSAMIRTARSEGRDLTDEELDSLSAQDDQARDELAAAIARSRH